jgi:Type VI secretion system, TssO
MQTPLNTAERSSAFWKFFLFFLISVLMVTTAVYFDFKLPYKENELLKNKTEQNRLQAMAQEKFTNSMIQAKALLDSMGKPGINVKYISDQVTDKLRELTNLQITDNSLQGGMNKAILAVFLDYNKIKGEMTNMGDAQMQIADLTGKNAQLTQERDQIRRDYDLCLKGIGR